MFLLSFLSASVFGLVHFFATATAPDWYDKVLSTGGPFGIILILIIFDKLTTTGERDRLREENRELREEIKLLNENIRKEIVPALVQLNELMKEVVDELSEVRRESTRGRRA